MKKLILFAVASILFIGASAQNYTMVVQKTDGTEYFWSYDLNPTITFYDEGFKITSLDNSSDAVYNFTDVAKIYFKTASSLNGIEQNDVVILYPNPTTSSLRIVGAENQRTEIFSMDGRMIYSGINNGKDINVSNFEKGVYAVRINGKTLKFSKL
ncbi:MAG: T9SS type A sorting domain-containing protein [Bacteroidales bacterium]|nr:T9SS type A sorting domain-containing protein [Bacteroidales bacterium]